MLNRAERNYYSSCKVITLLKNFMRINSVIDIGCGVGNMLKACSDLGAEVIRGVDGSWVKPEFLLIPPERFTQYDLSQPDLAGKIPEKHFDLTVSSEVAEHLEPKDADVFMDNLTAFSDVILFSAAIPGQGGDHHVNEQWPSYWLARFRARGFVPVDCIRPEIWSDNSIRADYRQNLFVLVRESALEEYPAFKKDAGRTVLDAAHPVLWEGRVAASNIPAMGFRPLCRMTASCILHLVPAFVRAVMKRLRA